MKCAKANCENEAEDGSNYCAQHRPTNSFLDAEYRSAQPEAEDED